MSSKGGSTERRPPRTFARLAVHVHSEYSHDAWETVPRIMAAAGAAGLDAVLLTDHDNLGALEAGLDGWHGTCALIVGCELSPPCNHYLAFDISEPVSPDQPPQDFVDEVRQQGGLGFVAHPMAESSPLLPELASPWKAQEVTGFTGIELWTYLDSWATAVKSPLQAVRYYRNPDLALRGPHPRALAWWDELCQRQRTVAVAGLDAHAFRIVRELRRLGVPAPPIISANALLFDYGFMFRTLRTNAYVEPVPTAVGDIPPFSVFREQVLDALRSGDVFCSYDVLGDPWGFDFFIRAYDGRIFTQGELAEEPPAGPVEADVYIPPNPVSDLVLGRLVHDGEALQEQDVAPGSCWNIGPLPRTGVYRVELAVGRNRRYKPWIYSNPIYLRA